MAALTRAAASVLLFVTASRLAPAQGPRGVSPAHVGVVLDGPSEYNRAVLAEFQREMTAFFGTERTIEFAPHATLEADWTPAGAGTAIDRLFADPGVDLVLALGPIGSNELAHRKALPKPAIAALIVDPDLQDLPMQPRRAGFATCRCVTRRSAG